MFNKILNMFTSNPNEISSVAPQQSENISGDKVAARFLSLAQRRRTIYALGKTLPVPDIDIIHTIKEAVRQAPSAFNSQSSRIVILLGEEHIRFWEMTREQLRKIVPADNFQPTSDKIDGFAAAAGSVLFYEDQKVVKGLQEQFAAYADNFPVWSEQSSGIAQYAVWLALTEKGVGANLQHYNPLVDGDVQRTWNVPESWKLRAHMNFGEMTMPAGDKSFIADEDRFIIAG